MEKKEFTYEIGGKRYVQRPLVLGQVRQLSELADGMALPESANVTEVVGLLGDKMFRALAVVLTEEGTSPGDKDIEKLADELEWAMEPEMAIEVVEDFFDCTPIASLLERIGGLLDRFATKVRETGSRKSASSSPTGTSPGETRSSGGSPPESASPTSSTGAVR